MHAEARMIAKFGKNVEQVKCPVCNARFKYTHVCREIPNRNVTGGTCITRQWALNPPKKYRTNDS